MGTEPVEELPSTVRLNVPCSSQEHGPTCEKCGGTGRVGVDLALRPPGYTDCADVWLSAGHNWRRAAAAALGLCWQSRAHPKANYLLHSCNPLSYGAAVLDELVVQRGYLPDEVAAAGVVALEHCRRVFDRFSEKEVAAAADFSEGGAGSTG